MIKKATKPVRKKSNKQLLKESYEPQNLSDTTLGFSAKLMNVIKKKTGDPTISLASDAGKLIVGLPCPSFALEYILCNTVLPLEKVVQLYGKRGIGKSALALEIARWVFQCNGIGVLLEHESKYNGDWGNSILDGIVDKVYVQTSGRLSVIPCDSVDEWQANWLMSHAHVQRQMYGTKEEPGPGKIFPFIAIVDSLMGKTMKETQARIDRDGSAGRAFPVEALSISQFIRSKASVLRRWPFITVLVNHLKVNKGESGRDEESRSGGQTIDFQSSFDFKVSRVRKIRTAEIGGNRLRIQMAKNSYGEDDRSCVVNLTWRDIILPDGTRVQDTRFDWHAATADLISTMSGAGGKTSHGKEETTKGRTWTAAKKLTGLVKDSDYKCHSKILGIKEAAPMAAAGLAIANNPQMMEDLRDIFSVRRRKVFRNDIDFEKQLLEVKKETAAL